MRTMALGIAALLAGGCASAPMVDLVPRGAGASSARACDVRLESTEATVVAHFAGPWRQWFVFDLTVVNRSDSALVVAPEDFSITLARDHPQKTLGRAIHAVGSERVLDVLDSGQSRESVLWGLLLGLEGAAMVANAVGTIAADVQGSADDQDAHKQLAEDLGVLGTITVNAAATRTEDLSDEHYRWARSALLRTVLAPRASVSGTIAVPGTPFRSLLAPYEPAPDESDWSITGPPRRPRHGYRLTLHTPTNLGGQRFEFDVGGP